MDGRAEQGGCIVSDKKQEDVITEAELFAELERVRNKYHDDSSVKRIMTERQYSVLKKAREGNPVIPWRLIAQFWQAHSLGEQIKSDTLAKWYEREKIRKED